MIFKDELQQRKSAWLGFLKTRRRRLDSKEEAIFLRQLSLMLDAGLPFFDTLTMLAETMEGRSAELAEELTIHLHKGYPLSQAFKRVKDRVAPVVPPLVETGEKGGKLVHVLHLAADWAEMSTDLGRRVKAALVYPVFVLVVNLILGAVMLVRVFPIFIPLFEGEALPLPTRGLVAVSWLLQSKLFWLVAVLVGVELFLYFTHEENRQKIHSLLLMVPVLGGLLRSVARTRFSAVLAVTSKSGIAMMRGFELAARVSQDPDFIRLDGELQARVREGESFADHFLEHSQTYGLILAHSLSLCQETGQTDVICSHLTKLFHEDTDLRFVQFQSVLEPLLIAMVSLTTATLLLAIYWPLGHFLTTLL